MRSLKSLHENAPTALRSFGIFPKRLLQLYRAPSGHPSSISSRSAKASRPPSRVACSPGARLPSWLDLAAQLGVARGTVRSAYEKLSVAQLIVASRATGTHVTDRLSTTVREEDAPAPGAFKSSPRGRRSSRWAYPRRKPSPSNSSPRSLTALGDERRCWAKC
jgi:hypothetical protein